MPALTVTLTLDFPEYLHGGLGCSYSRTGGDIVAFVSGLLLGNDQSVRNWFSMFTRARPKVKIHFYIFFKQKFSAKGYRLILILFFLIENARE